LAVPHVQAVSDGDDALSRRTAHGEHTEAENESCDSALEEFEVPYLQAAAQWVA
jgi:hypothetical protein